MKWKDRLYSKTRTSYDSNIGIYLLLILTCIIRYHIAIECDMGCSLTTTDITDEIKINNKLNQKYGLQTVITFWDLLFISRKSSWLRKFDIVSIEHTENILSYKLL